MNLKTINMNAEEFWKKQEKEMIDKIGLNLMIEEKLYFVTEVWWFMEAYHEARMKDELIDLVRLARKGSHVSSWGNQPHWKFDIDRDKQVVDDYLATRKSQTNKK